MSVTGAPDGAPVKCGVPVSDLGAGVFAAIAILGALHARMATGRGQYLETSLYDAAVALSIWETAELWSTGRTPGPLGSAHRLLAPYQALRTRDGYLTVGGNNERLWSRLCHALGRPDLPDDPRFATNAARLEHRSELEAELQTTLAARDTDEWIEVLLAAGVPAGPLRTYPEVVVDPHTVARGLVTQVDHPSQGAVPTLGIPYHLRGTPARIRRAAPLLGEHTAEVLAEVGFGDDAGRGDG